MYRKAFTLQELLISMAIIGLIAAAIAPAINSIMPDKRKAMYMKAYNTLTNVTSEILADPSLYWTNYKTDGEAKCTGLSCTNLPSGYEPCNKDDWKCEGIGKFPMIFATKVNYTERKEIPSIIPIANSKSYSVKTVDGIEFTFAVSAMPDFTFNPFTPSLLMINPLALFEGVEQKPFEPIDPNPIIPVDPSDPDESVNPPEFPKPPFVTLPDDEDDSDGDGDNSDLDLGDFVLGYLITHTVTVDVNVNNTNSKNKCIYSSTCQNPDMFRFKIDAEGGITADDPLGKAFLENPTDMKSIREDKVRANEILAGKK